MQRLLIRHNDGTVDTAADLDFLAEILNDPLCTLWVDAEGEPAEALEALARRFDLHPLTLEDLSRRDPRPKLQEFDQYVSLALQTIRAFQGDAVETDGLHIVLKKNCLLTVHDRPLPVVQRVFDRCRAEPRTLERGASFLLYLVSDAVVDGCFPVLDALGDEIDRLEDAVVATPTRPRVRRIFELKRVLLRLGRIVTPLREVYNSLSRRDYPHTDPRAAIYFRDVHDALVRAFEMIDAYRDLVSNTLDASLAATSNRLTQAMKQLTLIATIFMPLAFLTGFFGMNFAGIPYNRGWLLGAVLALMAGLPVVMLLFFARRGWLGDGRSGRGWARLWGRLRRRG